MRARSGQAQRRSPGCSGPGESAIDFDLPRVPHRCASSGSPPRIDTPETRLTACPPAPKSRLMTLSRIGPRHKAVCRWPSTNAAATNRQATPCDAAAKDPEQQNDQRQREQPPSRALGRRPLSMICVREGRFEPMAKLRERRQVGKLCTVINQVGTVRSDLDPRHARACRCSLQRVSCRHCSLVLTAAGRRADGSQ